jgi:hypothetical protein
VHELNEKESTSFPKPSEFFFKIPLYQKFDVEERTSPLLWDVEYFKGPLDHYCPECGRDSIFHQDLKGLSDIHRLKPILFQRNYHFVVHLTCKRDVKHELRFHFRCWNQTVQKIG